MAAPKGNQYGVGHGRPTTYSQELADTICERLAAGESMRSVSRDKSMPCMATLFKWLREHDSFSEQYAKAKLESADALVEDMLDIADNQCEIPLYKDGLPVLDENDDQVMVRDSVAVNHARLRVDTRKWAASKLKPKKYGDKVFNEHSGSIGNYSEMTKEELDAKVQQRLRELEESERDD